MRPIPNTKSEAPLTSPQRAPRSTVPFTRAGAQRTYRSRLLFTLASVCGLIVWLSLTFLTTGNVLPPSASLFSSALDYWRAGAMYGEGLAHTSGYASGGLPQLTSPLHCDSSGASSLGSDLIVSPSEVICGDVLVVGANAMTQGEVRGSIQVMGGNAVISGSVTGDVTVIGGNISVQPGGRVYGAAHAIGGSVIAAPSAIVNNTGSDIQIPRDLTQTPGLNAPIDVGSFWLSLLFWISAALGLSALAPEMVGHVRSTISRHFALSGVVGALLALATGLVSVALVFTCLGIPLALAIAVAAWFAWVVGTVGLGAWLGGALFSGPCGSHPPSLIVSAILGVLVLCVLKALPVAGPIVGLLSGIVALGSAALTLLSARRASQVRSR